MRTKILLFLNAVLISALILFYTGCKKDNVCYTCTSSIDKADICEKDNSSIDDFNGAKDALELTGYIYRKK